jgi:DNA (cytosine-5)-methyltransferase 1
MSNNKYKFIDLFAGIGGMRIPFEEAGLECVFSSEIDKYARKTYEAYFGDIPSGDITLINPKTIPKFDILLAGFPCQPFSHAGLKKGLNDHRGGMFFKIKDILETHKPKAFLLENVRGLTIHDNKKTLERIIKELESLNYHVTSSVLAAKDFNLPQRRERIYIVGFKTKKAKENFEFPKPVKLTKKLKSILEKNPDKKYTISDRLWIGHQERKERNKKRGVGFGYSIFDESSLYVNTISARYYKDGSEVLIKQDNKNPRKITPIEAARLQGFPDQIVKKAQKHNVSDVQLYKQFGNAVPVNVVRAIAKNIIELIN